MSVFDNTCRHVLISYGSEPDTTLTSRLECDSLVLFLEISDATMKGITFKNFFLRDAQYECEIYGVTWK